MTYIELYIPSPDRVRSEIYMAELADFPFESFEQEDTYLKAYIREADLVGCRSEVEDFLRTTGVEWRFTSIETVNWNSLWESNFTPVEVGDRLCGIRAPFHPPFEGCEMEIVIMPKMSFGTGHHATTYLMAAEIMRRNFHGLKGLDMGSGTGVLAIIAVKRGAEHVDAVDIDEWAYENCEENIAVNGVKNNIRPVLGDISAVADRQYDFILANINRNVLLEDMPVYVSILKKGGPLIMSGILEQDMPIITEKAESLCLVKEASAVKDGWAMLAFSKPA